MHFNLKFQFKNRKRYRWVFEIPNQNLSHWEDSPNWWVKTMECFRFNGKTVSFELCSRSFFVIAGNYFHISHYEGHSLGAHIAGSAGRNLNYKTDKLLPRITGRHMNSIHNSLLIFMWFHWNNQILCAFSFLYLFFNNSGLDPASKYKFYSNVFKSVF